MIACLAAFAAVALLTPLAARLLGRRVFAVIALLPAAVFVLLLTWLPGVLAGNPVVEVVPWIPTLDISLSFRLDALALLLALIVTGIGALVLLYCVHYFADDEPALGRFAALLLAFTGVMFGLVTADDVFVLFTFWEATSVLSYLLIGHYTGRKESRGAALQALTVTTFGGLSMLVGLVILAVAGGTTSLSELVEHPVTGAAGEWAIALVLLGAISKSALVPFHFWLPAAMAAPTPVSAYLHAAAMVKAGVYLVARLAPGYAELEVWHPVVVVLGVLTMLAGGWRALRQYDVKLLLAYGTVSQLGFLVLVTGFGTRDAALAGVTLLLAHALFKAALFLVVGIVDHAAGTRDWRKLSGLGRRMPVIATIAFVAAASMAGVPPLLGFVAKEAVFTAFLGAVAAGDAWAWVALIGAFLGSVLTVAYSVRFLWGAFFTKPALAPTALHAESRAMGIAPGLLAAASLVAAFTLPWIEPLLAAYAHELPGSDEYHLALWHGFGPALAISAVVFALGALLVWRRRRVARLQASVAPVIDSARGYLGIVSVVDRVAAAITTAIQHRGLPGYLAIIVVVFIGGVGATSIVNTAWPSGIRLWDFPAQPFLALVMGVAGVAAATVRQRMTAVLLVSVTGYGLVLLFGMSGAPDLALTQALVETIVIVVFVLVLRRLPKQIAQRNPPVHKTARLIIGAIAGLVMAVVGLVALGARIRPTIAEGLPALALEAHGKNIVNVMLVDIRAWDTLGEISVLVAVATGVASLIFVSGRTGGAPRLDDAHVGVDRRDRLRPVPEPAWSIRAPRTSLADTDGESDAAGEAAETRQTWLLAGRTISPRNRSILIEVLVRLLFHPAIVVSVFLLFVGHNAPGGGFAGGLLAGLALVARYLAGGRYELGEAAPVDAGRLLGSGLLLAAGTATGSLLFGGPVFESAWFEAGVPILGTISIGTSTLFDIGVYLVVVGLVLDVLRSLGGEVDRQQEQSGDDEGDPGDESGRDLEQGEGPELAHGAEYERVTGR
ncbi:Na+/H+ antiporter subunit A [Agromyces ramosus]|uniref:Multicomponent Na+:H+ antiporter subunit A n=1 Tax=Agromyces ramosus TaxID=33879 RepID=A0ABU0R6B5_9MICO|nr:Na+/H+ antiporter subunit A [Agromyces ramosus]MDQ0893631.1 multicomponent Na+:H+ antiporter subunit A [Agromyces ramosus]